MSIIDSATDRAEAELRLGVEDEAKLERDLAYWAIQEQDHHAEAVDVQRRLWALLELDKEAGAWVTLIASELRKRRDEKRARAVG